MCSLQRRGNIFLLTLTGPGEHRLNPKLLDAIQSSLRQVRSEAESAAAGGNSSSFALITTAEGKFFSNGYDIDWATTPIDQMILMDDKLKSVASELITLPMPTIAAVSGHASAAGFILAMSHDYVLMRRDRGFLYMSELDIRRVIPTWFTVLVKSKIGEATARRDVVLKAPKLTADKALELGIIDSAHDGVAETVAAAVRLAEDLTARNVNPFSYLGGGASAASSRHETQGDMRQYSSEFSEAERRYARQPNQGTATTGVNNTRGKQPLSNIHSIHTLKNDEDDERFKGRNSFWNGNSTQYGGEDDSK